MNKESSEKLSYCYLHLPAPQSEPVNPHLENREEALENTCNIVDFELKDDCSKHVVIIQM